MRRERSSRCSNLRYSCVSSHKLNGVTFTPGPVCSTRAKGGFKFSSCYPEHLCSHLNWFLISINSAGTAASTCFNFQAPPAPHKWAFMEYLKTLIFLFIACKFSANCFVLSNSAWCLCVQGRHRVPSGTDRCRQAGDLVEGSCCPTRWVPALPGAPQEGLRPRHGRGTLCPQTERPPNSRWCWVQAGGLSLWQPSLLLWHARDMRPWSPWSLRWQVSFCSNIVKPVWRKASLLEIPSGLWDVQGWRLHCKLCCG